MKGYGSLLTLEDYSPEQVMRIIDLGMSVKKAPEMYAKALAGVSVALLFQKTSTRTRTSFEVGVAEMGGHPLYIDWKTSNFTLGSLKDEAKTLSRYVGLIMARVYKHGDLIAMDEASTVPVINGLCDQYHPCQALADMMTIKEKLGALEGKKLAYVGDGNNVCNSLIIASAKTGMLISVGCPEGYGPAEDAIAIGKAAGVLTVTHDPLAAAKDADVLYTDTWVSMGEEDKAEVKVAALQPFQLNSEVQKAAKESALVMHCLPAHRGYEITDEVIDSPQSVVFDQAENRLHAQKALMLLILGKSA